MNTTRIFSINPLSDFLHDSKHQALLADKQAAWRAAQPDRITARDITSCDHEKIINDIDHARRGMSLDKALAMVEGAGSAGVIPKSWLEILSSRLRAAF